MKTPSDAGAEPSAQERFTEEGDRAILRCFVGADAAGTFVSGNQLAQQLGVSRPAIWGRFKRLEAEGFAFEGIRNRGYRLVRWPRQLHSALLEEELRANGCAGVRALYLPEVDSTNSEAERQLSYGRGTPLAVFSSAQTAGRGRMGRSWASASGDNVYVSVGLRPNLPPEAMRGLTLWVGVHLARGLSSLLGSGRIQLKWPNDLWIDGKKFGGLLTEAKFDADYMRTLIVGLGLNVNSDPASFPEEIRARATSLSAHAAHPLSLNRIAALCTRWICDAYHTTIDTQNDDQALVQAWREWDCLLGQPIRIHRLNTEISGTAVGIDARGALLVDQGAAGISAFQAGDVTTQTAENPA